MGPPLVMHVHTYKDFLKKLKMTVTAEKEKKKIKEKTIMLLKVGVNILHENLLPILTHHK